MTKVLLITPPFTQLNTPYPATAYLKGFLNTKKIESNQSDLGIEVILKLFSKSGLSNIFKIVENESRELSPNSERIFALKEQYISIIDNVMLFLQNKNATLAHLITEGEYLPEASRFEQLDDLEWAFGTLGLQDKAKHLATLFLEDISDFIKENIDSNFGFSRYAERLSMSANSFDELENALCMPLSYIEEILIKLLQEKIELLKPNLICISIPFPGNLFGGLRCGKFVKNNYPNIKVQMGGGYPNTELRSLSESRVFKYVDFISLDDGETPLANLIEFLNGKRELIHLKRTFTLIQNEVVYCNNSKDFDVAQSQVGAPDYSDLLLDKYISVIEVANPMHRLWSDGRWNKLTLAHGCYWGKCSFCDVSLNYIKDYEPITPRILCDRIEEIVAQTGETGFHFVDEAAPPALMRDLAIELLHRKINITWWTNIRFEKSFSQDLCKLLKASGCIAVSGGLEVASDRLLQKMKKGVSVEQVAQVTYNLTNAGIMVHAYLMYGFPTQSAQETIDSLEVVRQLFENGIVQSGFWHRFAMTAHSPIGIEPALFNVKNLSEKGKFANNDLIHEDLEGTNHELFSDGLKKALFNYMHGICFEYHLADWFEFKVPITTLPKNYIRKALKNDFKVEFNSNSKFIWIGSKPILFYFQETKRQKCEMIFHNIKESFAIEIEATLADWLNLQLIKASTFNELKTSFEESNFGDFEIFYLSENFRTLREKGWLVV